MKVEVAMLNPYPDGIVVVAITTFPLSLILILSDELVAKIIGLAPVVEAVKVPLFQMSGVLTEVENSD